MATHAERIRQALAALGTAKPREIIAWIQKNSDEKINIESYRGDLMGLSLNHPSSHHYSGIGKFLWFNASDKSYRLATPSEIAEFKEKQNRETKKEPEIIDEPFISKLSASGQIVIPSKIREKLDFKTGDSLALMINDQGVLEVRKVRVKVEYL